MYQPPEDQPSRTRAWESLVSFVGLALRLCCCLNQDDDTRCGRAAGSPAVHSAKGVQSWRLLTSESNTHQTFLTPQPTSAPCPAPCHSSLGSHRSGSRANLLLESRDREAALETALSPPRAPLLEHRSPSPGKVGGPRVPAGPEPPLLLLCAVGRPTLCV